MEKIFIKYRFFNKNIPYRCWYRCMSSKTQQAQDIKVRPVNKNIELVLQPSPPYQQRPLVLLFGWLFAQPRHLRKLAKMYSYHGFDVISVKIFLSQLLRPEITQSLMRNVLDLCLEEERTSQPIIIHGLSVGGYLYGEVLTNMQKYPEKYASVGDRFRGQIFDSVVDYYGIPEGVSRAMTRNEAVGTKIAGFLEWYMDRFKNITKHYIKSSDMFHDNQLGLPSIFLYSMSDVVCNPEHKERIIDDWRQKGIYVTSRSWEDAPHVSAFVKHNEEYKQTIADFIQSIGMIDNNSGNHVPISADIAYHSNKVHAANMRA